MTSGQFTSYDVSAIHVDRDLRQRRDPINISELAASIKAVGLINPIVIERDGKLLAGERRLMAVKSLGWDKITVQFVDELDEAQLQLIELEENVKREALPWQDECRAVQRYHALRSQADPEWNLAKTAEALAMAPPSVTEKINVARELDKGNARVTEAPKFSVARGIVQRTNERKAASAIESLTADITGIEVKPKVVPLINADFIEWSETYAGPPFNFLHCDFPYGVGADQHDQGAAASHGGYGDSFAVYESLIDALAFSQPKLVAESAHLMFWFSMDYYQWTFDRLTSMGWKVQPFPLYWLKSDNAGILPDPKRGPRRIVETAFIASRGDRKIVQPVSNAIASPTTKRIHMSEKPIPVLRHFFRMFVDEYTIMLDPTSGSGNGVRASSDAGASISLGVEKDPEFFNLAKEHYFDDVE